MKTKTLHLAAWLTLIFAYAVFIVACFEYVRVINP